MPLLVAVVKRVMDISISLVVLVLFIIFPLWLIPFFIWREDRGPILYAQKRCGQKGTVFKMYKFRTMIPNAEKHTGAVLQVTNDSRVTKIGNFLRKTRLDELPNFINVALGQMSVVGPRAERPEIYLDLIDQFPMVWQRTELVKPGITGEAQLSLRSDGSLDETDEFVQALPSNDRDQPEDVVRYKMYYDFAYAIKLHSFWSFLKTDLSIIFRTPYVMFFNRNVV